MMCVCGSSVDAPDCSKAILCVDEWCNCTKIASPDATWVVRDGAVGFIHSNAMGGDNRGDEVVVGRVIICDSVNLKRRKLKIASTRLTKWGNFPRSRQRFWKTKFTPIPLLWAQIRIGRTASLATWRQEMIEDDYCFRVMVGVWADLSAMYGIEWVESTVKRRKLVIWNSEN